MIPLSKPFLTEDEASAAHQAVLSGWVTQGKKVKEFEEKFAQHIGAPYAIAVSNCTVALELSLRVIELPQGAEVICPSYSYIASANAIVNAGGKPVFADCDESGNLQIADVEKKVTDNTFAVLAVHQLGMPLDVKKFRIFCKQKNLRLIEDAACAAGSKFQENFIGKDSEICCFSFHPRKVITTGEGGMIVTTERSIYQKLLLLRHHGMDISDVVRHTSDKVAFEKHVIKGFNARMTDIQASIGAEQLKKLDEMVDRRRENVLLYKSYLNDNRIEFPIEGKYVKTNFQSLSIRIKNGKPFRDQILFDLKQKGISAKRGVMCIHREPAYKEFNNLTLPVSESLSDESILLPLFHEIKEDEIKYVCEVLMKLLEKKISIP